MIQASQVEADIPVATPKAAMNPSTRVATSVSPTSTTAPPGQGEAVLAPEPLTSPAPVAAMTAADFPVPPARDLPLLAQQMRWNGANALAPGEHQNDGWQVGDVRNFWTLDYPRLEMVNSPFRLLAVSENAYWWASQDATVPDEAIEQAVGEAESRVFPRVEAVFASGHEPERLHIVSGRIPGVGGYVSGADRYPPSVSPYSNGVSAVYVNSRAAALGQDDFVHILAHELQHAIHQEADQSEATWLNEGIVGTGGQGSGGFRVSSVFGYLRQPSASLVNWPDHLGSDVGLNYGAAALFAHYLREHYAADGGLQDLLAIQSDGIEAVDQFLTQRQATSASGQPASFATVFADWMVANLLDADTGPYGYRGLDAKASITRWQETSGEKSTASLPQYGIDYVEIPDAEGSPPSVSREPPPRRYCQRTSWATVGGATAAIRSPRP